MHPNVTTTPDGTDETPTPTDLEGARRALHSRVRRAEGQLRGVARMLEEQRDCEDIVVQLMAGLWNPMSKSPAAAC